MDSDVNIFLNALRDSINNDPNQFNRAKTDSKYDGFRPQVDALLNEMYQKVKKNSEKEYHDLDYATQKMMKWFNNNYSNNSNDKSKYNNVIADLKIVQSKINKNDYDFYVEATDKMVDIRKTIYELQKSIKNDLDSVEKELNQIKNNDDIKHSIRDAYNEKNNLFWEKRKDFYAKIIVCCGILLLLVCSIAVLGYNENMGIPLMLLSTVLGTSALLALIESVNGKFLSQFFLFIIPSVLYVIIAAAVLAIVGSILELFFGKNAGIMLLIVLAVAVLGLMFGPFIIKDKDITSSISTAERNISTLENNENNKNQNIKHLQQKIQISKESL